MTDFIIQTRGFDELAQRLSPERYQTVVKTTMRGAVELLRNEIADYPPASAANRSPGINGYSWYVRGFGTRTRTGRAYATSEVLGKSWTTEVGMRAGLVEGVVGTNVSYAQFVQGEKQTGFHKARGWKTVKQVAEQNIAKIARLFESTIAKVLG